MSLSPLPAPQEHERQRQSQKGNNDVDTIAHRKMESALIVMRAQDQYDYQEPFSK
jgi:hypothetical protein